VAEPQEALSLLGDPLLRPPLAAATGRRLESDLERAREDQARNPGSEEGFIWVGRRLGYLGRYREAVEEFTRGLSVHPGSFRLLRHRGHRQITLRRLEEAVRDLAEAARLAEGVPDELEPDGMPNERNIPRSTTQSNIWYHLGLAHYFRGDFEPAEAAWRRCLEFSRVNDDMLVAASYWLVAAHWRRGVPEAARPLLEPIHPGMEIF
jgi:tetratricopeptide (TPR) repeat protein